MLDCSKFVEGLEGRAVYVYGLGKSGLACVEALSLSGANIIAWDAKAEQRNKAAHFGAVLSCEDDVDFQKVGCLLLSPGLPLTHPKPHPVVIKAQQHDIEIIGDIEIMGRCLPDGIKTIGITGTNGKSTTTALLGHVLQECDISSCIAGNIGTPILSVDIKDDLQAIVLELSSYQLDLCPSFHPNIGVLLNITPDHIDRHGSLAQYAAVKAKIFGRQTRAIISIDDDQSREIFEIEAELGKAPIALNLEDKPAILLEDLPTLMGDHNRQNALAVYHVCKQLYLKDHDILAAMKTFLGLAHRQQIVRKMGNITFINDSKATNAEAAAKALGTFENIYWILGGQAKDGGLQGLETFMSRVKKAYVIGEAAPEFSKWLKKEDIPFEVSQLLNKAVSKAYEEALLCDKPAIILLSPACASWDQFKSFEHRGDVFSQVVSKL